MANIIIFGNGAFAKLMGYYLTHDSDHEVIAYTVDKDFMAKESPGTFCGKPIVAFEEVESAYSPTAYKMIVAVTYSNMNLLRKEKCEEAKRKGYQLISYLSSKCTYLSQHAPGDNCIIMEDNTIQPFVKIGNDVVMWSGNHIGHDTIIEDHVFISSHVVISGWVKVKPFCFLGVNATIRNGITLGEATLVGAGAYIGTDTEPGSVYVPPRAVKINKKSHEIDL